MTDTLKQAAWECWVSARADMLRTSHNENIFKAGYDAALAAPQPDTEALAHEIWAAAQLAPGEGVVDGVGRIAVLLMTAVPQPAAPHAGPVVWVNGSTLKSASISQERGGPFDQHTWSECKTAFHDTALAAEPQPAAPAPDLQGEVDRLKETIAQMLAANAEMQETLEFVERWANHHGAKPSMTAQEALSCIQHYPPIKAITEGYRDGKVPDTFNPYSEIERLKAAPVAVREPLTQARAEGIMTELNSALSGVGGWGWIDVVRAVEKAHGIKQPGSESC